ncbi:MAG: hypothetical protein B7Y88_10275 [Sphingomonadales bacterium 32-64-17]|nr:MAG: hypothetical protein B7Y88_10275 [Sphingomonadales bacterium 32-64-17]
MAQIRKPAVPPKLFKHFAMATVALTAAVAMLADGSHREAKGDGELTQASESSAAREKPALLRRDIGRSDRASDGGDFYADSASAFGAPMVQPVRSGGTIAPQQASRGGIRPPVAGYSQTYLDSLSDEEYEALVEGLREAGMLDPDQRDFQVAALERESESRSGKATRD